MQSAAPFKQRWFGVYSEAWATYAEQLAADLGVYADDPRGEIGSLHWRLFRLARVIADTGQGVLGWSVERAAAEMRELQGRDIAFATIAADAARMRPESRWARTRRSNGSTTPGPVPQVMWKRGTLLPGPSAPCPPRSAQPTTGNSFRSCAASHERFSPAAKSTYACAHCRGQ